MNKKQKPSWLSLLKDYWWLGGVTLALAGTVSLYAAMPKRMEKVEQKNEKQDEEIVDLKGVASKIQGYTEALTKMQQQTTTPNAPIRSTPTVFREQDAEEVSDDGEIKVMKMNGKKLCCNGTDCWAWNKQTQCEH